MAFRQSSIDDLKGKADLRALVSEKIGLSVSGSQLRGKCPLPGCSDKTSASFFVSPSKNEFHCFSCGRGGDPIRFTMLTEGTDFVTTVKNLSERFGVTMEYEGNGGGRRDDDGNKSLYAANAAAAEFYASSLAKSQGMQYANLRRITEEAISTFRIGYGEGGLLRYLKGKGISEKDAVSAGLVSEGKERFRGRLLFPISDARGRILGFGGRAIAESVAKYINTGSTSIYDKSSVLFGLHQALPHIQNAGSAIVVEGYLDLVGVWQSGIRNVVATCGTAFSENHARLLRRYTSEVTIMFDNDLAGKKSAVRSAEILYAQGFVAPRIVVAKDVKDPHDWSISDPEGMRREIENAITVVEYIEKALHHRCDGSVNGNLAYLKTMTKFVAMVPDPVEKVVYLHMIERSATLPEGTLLLATSTPPIP